MDITLISSIAKSNVRIVDKVSMAHASKILSPSMVEYYQWFKLHTGPYYTAFP